MDWITLDSHLEKDQKPLVIRAQQFIDGTLKDVGPQDIAAVEKSLQWLSDMVKALPNTQARRAFYQEITAALCDRRDEFRSEKHINKNDTGAEQVQAFATNPDPKGNLILHAIAIINRPLVKTRVNRALRNDESFSSRSYAFGDLVQAATYGPFKVLQKDKTADSEFASSGLLAAAMKYDHHDERDASFASYAIPAIDKALERYAEMQNGNLRMIRIPGDMDVLEGKYGTRSQNELFIAPKEDGVEERYGREELSERMDEVLCTLTGREKTVLLARVQDGATLAEAGKIIGVTGERARHIQDRAIRKLQHPVRLRQFVDFIPTEVEQSWGRPYDMNTAAADARKEKDEDTLKKGRRSTTRKKKSVVESLSSSTDSPDLSITVKLRNGYFDESYLRTAETRLHEMLRSIDGLENATLGKPSSGCDLSIEVHNQFRGKQGMYLTLHAKDEAIFNKVKPVAESYDIERRETRTR